MNADVANTAAYVVAIVATLMLVGFAYSGRRYIENRRANRHYRAVLAQADARLTELECRGGPCDGEVHDRAEHWVCVEYGDSRGFALVTRATGLYLFRRGLVRWHGSYYDNGDHFDWRPMVSRFYNTIHVGGVR